MPALIAAMFVISGCLTPGDNKESPSPPENNFLIIFESGFEVNTTHVFAQSTNAPCTDDIRGIDASVDKGDWEADLEGSVFGEGVFCFGGGDRTQRGIDLVPDPVDSGNQVLHMWIREPGENVSDDDSTPCNGEEDGARKARIQHVLKDNSELIAFHYQVKIRLGQSFQDLIDSEYDFNWMTIGEFWNNQPSENNSFRITLNMIKPDNVSGTPFYFGLKADQQPEGQSKWYSVWEDELISSQEVPIAEWFTLGVTVVEGDFENGRVFIEITTDGATEPLFEVDDWTHHPEDDSPDGFRQINTMKLYTSGTVMCGMKAQNLQLEAWWDDYQIGII